MIKKQQTLLLYRVLLIVLIVLNMAAIFFFSAQNGEESDKTSSGVTKVVAQITVKDFTSKTGVEQKEIITQLHPPVRKLAHMAEFGSLGALIYLFLLTWNGGLVLKGAAALGATFLYACTDELHQMLSDSRGPQFSDVLIDLLGAFITCGILLILILFYQRLRKRRKMIQITRYAISNQRSNVRMRFAVVADLHGEDYRPVTDALQKEKPDMILIPGDLMEDDQLASPGSDGYEMLRISASIAPTFYSLGNHEIGCYHSGNPLNHHTPKLPSPQIRDAIAKTGVVLLQNEMIERNGITVCGLTSGIRGKESVPDQKTLDRLFAAKGFRVLLCHHPEYYVPYIQKEDIDLTVCGHAHGGQWRIFGRGIYAPGQGLFPKYTAGVLDQKCVISRGLGNHTWIPRIFNRRELVIIDYGYTASQDKKENKVIKMPLMRQNEIEKKRRKKHGCN